MLNDHSKTLPERVCMHCDYWHVGGKSLQSHRGECRRHAPQIASDGAGEGRWPKTASDDWCGEFKKIARLQELKKNSITFGIE